MLRSRLTAALAAGILLLAGGQLAAVTRVGGGAPPAPGPDPAAGPVPGAAYGELPLWFEANEGQAPAEADYVARAGGSSALVTGTGPAFSLPAPDGASRVVRLALAGAGRVAAEGLEPAPSRSNYLLGADPAGWRTGIAHFGRVAYRGVWPGIDLVYRGQDARLEYDFVVLPGAEPSTIEVVVEGADGLALTPEGDLVASAGDAELRQSRPVIHQEVGGVRRPVTGAFALTGPDRFGFRVGPYDRSRPLVIDPVLSWSTYLGGLGADPVTGIAVDGAGSAYVTGSTSSANFPVQNALQGARSGASDAFVAKLDPAGTGLVWSTYLGGGAADEGTAIAVDGGGNAVVVGSTASTNFPLADAFQATKGAGTATDAFVAQLNPAGSALSYSTYLGGSAADTGTGVALDPTGRAHVTGSTASGNFPTLNAYQGAKGAGTTADAFVAQLDVTAAGIPSLLYSTYLGGGAEEVGAAIAVDGAGRSYVTGETRSANFPTVAPLKGTISGACPTTNDAGRLCREAFVAKLDPAAGGAGSVLWSTYLGGTVSTYHLEIGEGGAGIAVDGAGSAYVTGSTSSDDFPAVNAVQPNRAGDVDAFVTKLSPGGDAIAFSTYLGGFGLDAGAAVAVDATGSAHVTGTGSASFPRVSPVAAVAGNADAVVARLTPDGSALLHSTHLGGTSSESGRAIAVDGGGAAFVGGSSFSVNFPTLDPVQAAPGGGNDGFVARIAPGPASGPLVTGVAPRSGPLSGGTPVVVTGAGFGGTTSVRFGGVPAASFQVDSPTRMVAVSPEGVGAARVTVTTPSGTSPANPVADFTYGEGLWSPTGPQTQLRLAPTMTLLANGKVLLAGGRSASNGPALATAELYDPLTDRWSPTGGLATPRFSHTATLLADGRVLVAGGFSLDKPVFTPAGALTNAGPVLDSAEVFDPATGTWSPTGSLASRRAIHTATLLPDGRVLAAGGRTCNAPPPTSCDASRFTNTAELYDPGTGSWSPTGALAFGRHTADAVPLADGRVLTAGGFGVAGTADVVPVPGVNQQNLAATEIFDPASGAWSTTGALNIGRARHSLVRQLDGRVLAVAGFPAGASSSTETFDPATGAWTITSVLPVARSGQCTVLLPTGDVLSHVPGAHPTDLYDPDTGTWRSAGLTSAIHGCTTGVTRADAVVLSSNPFRFEADPAVCGRNCGKALLAGDTDQAVGDLYTHRPALTGVTGVGSPAGGTTVVLEGLGLTEAAEVRFGGVPALDYRVDSYSRITAVVPPGPAGLSEATVTTPGGRSEPAPFTYANGTGYWTVAADGGIFSFGEVAFHGSTGDLVLNRPVVGMAAHPSGDGYWLVASDGGIFSFGRVAFHGSTGDLRLNQPVVGMAATPSGDGYWLVASDGGIFSFGDAAFFGSTGDLVLNRPVVGMAATPSGDGYWLVASDGGIFSFGDAAFFGSTGDIRLNRPVVGMDTNQSGDGYWLVASDGGIFSFGAVAFFGSTGDLRLNRPVVGMEATPAGGGYWLVASDGGIFSFGDAAFFGSTGDIRLNQPMVGMASRSNAR